jgi:hypothetical protein
MAGGAVVARKRPAVGFRIAAVVVAAVLAYLLSLQVDGSNVVYLYGAFSAVVVTFITGDTIRPTGFLRTLAGGRGREESENS